MGEVVEAALINLLSELICRVDRVDILQHAIDDSEEFLAHLNIFVAVIDITASPGSGSFAFQFLRESSPLCSNVLTVPSSSISMLLS